MQDSLSGSPLVRTPDRGLPVALSGMLALASSLGIGRFVYTPILPSMAAALGFGAGTAGADRVGQLSRLPRRGGRGHRAGAAWRAPGLVRRRTAGGRRDDRGDGCRQRAEAVPAAAVLWAARPARSCSCWGPPSVLDALAGGRAEWAALAALCRRRAGDRGFRDRRVGARGERRGLAGALDRGRGDRGGDDPGAGRRAALAGAGRRRPRRPGPARPGPAAALDMPLPVRASAMS